MHDRVGLTTVHRMGIVRKVGVRDDEGWRDANKLDGLHQHVGPGMGEEELSRFVFI